MTFGLYCEGSIVTNGHWSLRKYIHIIYFFKTISLTVDTDKAVHLIRRMSENWS